MRPKRRLEPEPLNPDLFINRWLELKVPEIEVVFNAELALHNATAWYRREEISEMTDSHFLILRRENPIEETAYHIAVVLPKYPEELKVAYYLEAFCRDVLERHASWPEFMPKLTDDYHNIRFEVVAPVFKKHEFTLSDWWHPNARHVLPPANTWNIELGVHDVRRWIDVVDIAAAVWAKAASELVIVKRVDWLDRDSFEYRRCMALYAELKKRGKIW